MGHLEEVQVVSNLLLEEVEGGQGMVLVEEEVVLVWEVAVLKMGEVVLVMTEVVLVTDVAAVQHSPCILLRM